MAKPKALHLIDGTPMTVDEIAQMLGITRNALYTRRGRLGGIGYQAIVNLYRANAFGNTHDRAGRYRFDGRWLTQRQIAEELGVRYRTLSAWRTNHRHPDGSPGTMMEAVEYYRHINSGVRVRGHGCGRKSTVYMVHGKAWTVKAVAEHFGYSRITVYHQFWDRGGDMAAVISHFKQLNAKKREIEAQKIARAERKILRILKEATST